MAQRCLEDRVSEFAGQRGRQALLMEVDVTDSDRIVVLVRDLLFSSRISATAKAVGANVKLLRDPAQLAAADGEKLIVDLNQPGAMEAAAEWKTRTSGIVIGFASHTDSATIARARELRIDLVLARSAFVAQLSQLLHESSDAGDGDADDAS